MLRHSYIDMVMNTFSGNIYEARRMILGCTDGEEKVVASIPPTYLITSTDPAFTFRNIKTMSFFLHWLTHLSTGRYSVSIQCSIDLLSLSQRIWVLGSSVTYYRLFNTILWLSSYASISW